MTMRKITRQSREARHTFVFLECGHHRSIGGGILLIGSTVGDVALLREYDCQEGRCYEPRQAA